MRVFDQPSTYRLTAAVSTDAKFPAPRLSVTWEESLQAGRGRLWRTISDRAAHGINNNNHYRLRGRLRPGSVTLKHRQTRSSGIDQGLMVWRTTLEYRGWLASSPLVLFVGRAQPCTTGFSSVPIPSILISTRSPTASVKLLSGTMPVPVRRNAPVGNELSRPNQPIRSSKERAM